MAPLNNIKHSRITHLKSMQVKLLTSIPLTAKKENCIEKKKKVSNTLDIFTSTQTSFTKAIKYIESDIVYIFM